MVRDMESIEFVLALTALVGGSSTTPQFIGFVCFAHAFATRRAGSVPTHGGKTPHHVSSRPVQTVSSTLLAGRLLLGRANALMVSPLSYITHILDRWNVLSTARTSFRPTGG
jgi:hypothetical protein